MQLLENERLVTLTGAPGIGKSRLSLELAGWLDSGFTGGVSVVELAPVTAPEDVPRAIAATLSVDEQPGQRLIDTIVARLQRRHGLILIDNCEHLLAACAEQVAALLDGCPQLRILATSREPLGLAAERVWQVPPLPVPDEGMHSLEMLGAQPAARLFVERAQAVRPGFTLNAYVAPAVAEICRRLDGIPLAIELAAARVGSVTAAEIARRLDDRFALLTEGSLSAIPRHQTLQAALDWSHDLLSPPERALLRRLSVFAGGFDLEAAEAVCAGAELERSTVRDALGGLLARSLLLADLPTINEPRACCGLLETIRAYAGTKLEEAGETAGVREEHARYYLGLAEDAEPQLNGPHQDRWLNRLDSERANLRAAMGWSLAGGESDWALRLAGALVLFWRVRCHFSEGRELLEAALSAGSGAAPALEAKALWGAGFMALMTGDLDTAVEAVEESRMRFEELGDLQGRARALLVLGNCGQLRADPGALALVEESAALARQAGDSWCLTHALGVAGFLHGGRDELAAGRVALDEGLAVAREAQNEQGLRIGLLGLGLIAIRQGDYRSAEPVLREAAAVSTELGDDYSRATALQYLGQLAGGRGDFQRARELLEQGMAIIREIGPRTALLESLVPLGHVAHAEGDPRGARLLFEEAMVVARSENGRSLHAMLGHAALSAEDGNASAARCIFEEVLEAAQDGDRLARAQAFDGQGHLALADGELRRAAVLHGEALELRRETGSRPEIVASLEALAGLAAQGDRCEHAAQLLGAAQACRDANGYARDRWASSRYDAAVARCRERLTPEAFWAAFNRGAGLSIDQAAAQASGPRGPRGRPSNGWSSLTASERRVAALAAEGLTNRQIAEDLFISLGTVKAHLSQSYSKLGVEGRRELARAARWWPGRRPTRTPG